VPKKVQPTTPEDARPDEDLSDIEQMVFDLENTDEMWEKGRAWRIAWARKNEAEKKRQAEAAASAEAPGEGEE
jgi:hypothetical protein